MDKLKMQTADGTKQNIERIAQLFPNCVTEVMKDGKETLAIDFDRLRQELSDHVVEGNDERYQFTWPDKRKAQLAANAPISATLRPCREESVDFDTTGNLYIEGDNLDVLKCLKETYSGKIKMIYIDPPYNTGNDFVYNDDFAESASEYLANSGQYDDQGNRLVTNTESNGRYHTDWLNMIYPRLKVARDLLTDDGVIFISIDENEVSNLKRIGAEVFGENNFVGAVIWERAFSPKNDAKYLSDSHDYILIFAKNINMFAIGKLPRTEEMNARYKNPDNDPRGPWSSGDLTAKTYSAAYDYPITTPSGKIISPTNGRSWVTSKDNMLKLIKDNRIWFGENGDNTPRYKRFLSEMNDGVVATTIWKYEDVGHSQEGRQELKKLFNDKGYFDGPKPIRLLSRVFQIANLSKNDIILDFFSGSASTAHALIKLNTEDGGNRKFIMVQLPEQTDAKSEAYKAGYKNICEIGKERIRRAGKKIKAENPNATALDTGFRVLKLADSNMLDVYYSPAEVVQQDLFAQADNIKSDRTPEDLLFQVMLELGVLLDSKIEVQQVAGKQIYNVADGFLIACFDKGVTDEVITAIAKQHPQYAVLRDSSYADDSTATNFEQLFKTYSPSTTIKTL